MLAWRDLRRAASRARQATRAELWFAARAWLLAPLVGGGLSTLGVRRTLAIVGALRRPAFLPEPRVRLGVEQGAAWVHRAYALHVVRGRCLPRACVQQALHRLDGTRSRLVIGVRRSGAAGSNGSSAAPLGIDAHAWVAPPDAPPDAEFAALLVLDEAGIHGAPE